MSPRLIPCPWGSGLCSEGQRGMGQPGARSASLCSQGPGGILPPSLQTQVVVGSAVCARPSCQLRPQALGTSVGACLGRDRRICPLRTQPPTWCSFPLRALCCPVDASPQGVCCLLSHALPRELQSTPRGLVLPTRAACSRACVLSALLTGWVTCGVQGPALPAPEGPGAGARAVGRCPSLSLEARWERRADAPLCRFVPRMWAAIFGSCPAVVSWSMV